MSRRRLPILVVAASIVAAVVAPFASGAFAGVSRGRTPRMITTVARADMAAAASGLEDTAPGRVTVVLPPGSGVQPGCGEACDSVSGPTALAPLASGGFVAAGSDVAGGEDVVEMTAGGALVTSFGDRGIATLGGVAAKLTVAQVLARPDGGVVLIGRLPSHAVGLPILVSLLPDGSPDPAFGTDGVVTTSGLSIGEGRGGPANSGALDAGGDTILAGTTTSAEGSVPAGHFVVLAVTRQGTLDTAFGRGGLADAGSGIGMRAVVAPDGSVAALGATSATAKAQGVLVKLTGSGAPDAQFGAGGRVLAPSSIHPSQLLASADGSLVLFDTGGLVARYTPTGSLDSSFGHNGVGQLDAGDLSGLLLALQDGDLVAVSPAGSPNGVIATALTSAGSADTSLRGADGTILNLAFGGLAALSEGGTAGSFTGPTAGFATTGLLLATTLSGGSIVLAASVQANIGDSSRGSLRSWGFAALTPQLTPLASFGGAQQLVLSVALAPNARHAASSGPQHPSCVIAGTAAVGLHLLVTSSAPGNVNIFVRSGARLIATGTALVSAASANDACVRLAPGASAAAAGGGTLPITIQVNGVDLAGNRATIRQTVTVPSAVLASPGMPRLELTVPHLSLVAVPLSGTATLTGGADPTGTITFSLNGPNGPAACESPAVFSSRVQVSGDGHYSSPGFTPGKPGVYRWTVAYSGDAHNVRSGSWCTDVTTVSLNA